MFSVGFVVVSVSILNFTGIAYLLLNRAVVRTASCRAVVCPASLAQHLVLFDPNKSGRTTAIERLGSRLRRRHFRIRTEWLGLDFEAG